MLEPIALGPMNPVYYKSGYVQSSPSLLNLTEWQEKEKANPVNCAVDKDGQLLVRNGRMASWGARSPTVESSRVRPSSGRRTT